MLVRDCSYVRERSCEWSIRNGTSSASYAFEHVHRFSVEAAMHHMPLTAMHWTAAYLLHAN